MKIVVCPDSFKGSMGAAEVVETIALYLSAIYPHAEIIQNPLADGGEGTAELIAEDSFPIPKEIETHDPLGRKRRVVINTDISGKHVFIESARIIGLPLLSKEERNPLMASTFGLGEVIQKAIDSGCEAITVSLGGSATCDGGKGMMEALNFRKPENVIFNIVCDVTNPLLGDNGAVKIFAPQKGAKPADIPVLEKRLKEFSEEMLDRGICHPDDIIREGAGAAGGLGFAFQSILKANTFKGIDFVLDITAFRNKIKGADLIITGEGKVDSQSLMGKVLSGVLREAGKENIPVIILAGKVEDREILLKAGVKEIYEISESQQSSEENMKPENTKKNLRKTVKIMSKSNIFKQNKA